MFYLPDEMFKQKGQTIELIIGKPIQNEILNQNQSAKGGAALIRAFVYNLDKKPDMLFEEFIKN